MTDRSISHDMSMVWGEQAEWVAYVWAQHAYRMETDR